MVACSSAEEILNFVRADLMAGPIAILVVATGCVLALFGS